jgi:hypothetical protein
VKKGEYFDGPMNSRAMLIWAGGVHRQLDRWELLVAEGVARAIVPSLGPMAPAAMWQGETEHHLLLVASAQLELAWRKAQSRPNAEDAMWREVRQTRDLLEHWDENMHVLNQHPRVGQPAEKSGEASAERYPDDSPYSWRRWSSTFGPMATVGVPGSALRAVAEGVENHVLRDRPELRPYLAVRAESPWVGDAGGTQSRWLPRALWG